MHATAALLDDGLGVTTGRFASAQVRLRVRPSGSRHHVLTTGQPLNVRNVLTDPRISDESRRRYLLRGYDVMSILLAPVHDADGKVIGLVEVRIAVGA